MCLLFITHSSLLKGSILSPLLILQILLFPTGFKQQLYSRCSFKWCCVSSHLSLFITKFSLLYRQYFSLKSKTSKLLTSEEVCGKRLLCACHMALSTCKIQP